MVKILIWGVGERTAYYMNMEFLKKCNIRGFIDTYKKGEQYCGYTVLGVDEVVTIQSQIDYIVIANEFYSEIIELCKEKNIDMSKLVMTDNIPLEPYQTYYKRVLFVSEELYEVLERTSHILVKSNEYDLIDKNMCMKNGKYARAVYMQDYFRYRTFELMANELNENNIPGAVAELGVFRGHFSSLINEHFKERKIYLFDTFEGFEEKEAGEELRQGRCDEKFIKEHKDTSVERMLANIPYADKAVVCKGFFPQSVSEEAEQEEYAFVSLDVDFEESMYQGLKFFYPRLSNGGVIFVHDYNTYFLEGIKRAVKRYEMEENISLNKIPIADRAGTLIIIKNKRE